MEGILQLIHRSLLIRETDSENEKLKAMLNSITWAQYFTTVTLLLVCYYVFIGFRFYRWELLGLFGIKKIEDNVIATATVADFRQSFETERNEDYFPKPVLEVDISQVVKSFIDEVKAYMEESDDEISKDEILLSLKIIVNKYPVFQTVDYNHELVQFMFDKSNAKYPNLLQLNDLKKLLS